MKLDNELVTHLAMRALRRCHNTYDPDYDISRYIGLSGLLHPNYGMI